MPNLRTSLWSIYLSIVDNGHTVIYDKNYAAILDRNGGLVGTAPRKGYCLESTTESAAAVSQKEENFEDWHQRYGHLNLWCQTAEEWGNPVYIQSVWKKVPLRDLSLNLASQTWTNLIRENWFRKKWFMDFHQNYPENLWRAKAVFLANR